MGSGSLPSRKRAISKIQSISRASEPGVVQKVTSQLTKAASHWHKILDSLTSRIKVSSKDLHAFLPMTALFFTMAFINTIVNNLSMSLVITAPMGSAGVLSFLTVYAALPLTFGATLLYAYASHFISPKKLFTITVGIFAACNLLFALCVFPNHEALHLPGVADAMAKILPSGLDGAVGMVRNWTFSAFYCLSEMWGDLGISLLFWGFANDITTSKQAPIFYPLMGIGANIAQILGGRVLKAFAAGSAASFSSSLQSLLLKLVGCMVIVMALHQYIAHKADKRLKPTRPEHPKRIKKTLKEKIPQSIKETERQPIIKKLRDTQEKTEGEKRGNARPLRGICQSQLHLLPHAPYSMSKKRNVLQTTFRPEDLGRMPIICIPEEPTTERKKAQPMKKEEKKARPSFKDTVKSLGDNPIVKSLGVMTIAQAVSVTLMEFVWKSHCRLAYPTPAAFSAFMGDVATYIGVVTCGMMVLSPILFNRIGWKGVASITPALMTFGGCAFFALCSAFHIMGKLGMTQMAQQLLPLTVLGGAFLFILSRGTKFSLFKPSEEIIFINMEAEKRQKAKATVDVLGANLGKSGGSLLQQALLVMFGGHLTFITPVMFAVYMTMMRGWNRAIDCLSDFQEKIKAKANSSEVEDRLESNTVPLARAEKTTEPKRRLQEGNQLEGENKVKSSKLESFPLMDLEEEGLKSTPIDLNETGTTKEVKQAVALV